MSRSPDLYLRDILTSCERVMGYIQGLDQEDFERDQLTMDSVIRNLKILGEAVKQIPDDILTAHTEVDWRGIAGLRDIVSHVYFGVDLDIIWDVAKNKVPSLHVAIQQILNAREPKI